VCTVIALGDSLIRREPDVDDTIAPEELEYVATHRWADFAEYFVHYLHIPDTIDTAPGSPG
jgi:hypothetical protein